MAQYSRKDVTKFRRGIQIGKTSFDAVEKQRARLSSGDLEEVSR
jgi:hypothetical protein